MISFRCFSLPYFSKTKGDKQKLIANKFCLLVGILTSVTPSIMPSPNTHTLGGTIILSVNTKDGVIFAADRKSRAESGEVAFDVNQPHRKIVQINKNLVAVVSGVTLLCTSAGGNDDGQMRLHVDFDLNELLKQLPEKIEGFKTIPSAQDMETAREIVEFEFEKVRQSQLEPAPIIGEKNGPVTTALFVWIGNEQIEGRAIQIFPGDSPGAPVKCLTGAMLNNPYSCSKPLIQGRMEVFNAIQDLSNLQFEKERSDFDIQRFVLYGEQLSPKDVDSTDAIRCIAKIIKLTFEKAEIIAPKWKGCIGSKVDVGLLTKNGFKWLKEDVEYDALLK